MASERLPRGTDPQGGYYNRSETQDYGRDYGAGREGSYSSARDYQAAGDLNRGGRGDYGREDYRRDHGRGDYGQNYSQYDRGFSDNSNYAGSYGSDGRRFESYGDRDRSTDRTGRDENRTNQYARREAGYRNDQARGQDRDDRGFFARAGDEVRSWFGDEDAERRRDRDEQSGMREQGRHGRDFGRDHDDYHHWRGTQIAALDRDYDEYRQENRTKFHNEFGTWRSQRQGQRDQLTRVKEHQEVVGSDGKHIGTVDHVRDDRILLTKNDQDAGGRHHSIPSRWIESVDDKVKISKTADEAKSHWRDEENNSAMFGGDKAGGHSTIGQTNARQDGGTNLNQSFSGTY